MRTSGLAVAFSGVTVIIALAGLFLIDSKTAHSMAIGAIVVVGVAVLAAVTLLPALIDALGHRAYEPGKVVGKVVAKLSRKPQARGRRSVLDALDEPPDEPPGALRHAARRC